MNKHYDELISIDYAEILLSNCCDINPSIGFIGESLYISCPKCGRAMSTSFYKETEVPKPFHRNVANIIYKWNNELNKFT